MVLLPGNGGAPAARVVVHAEERLVAQAVAAALRSAGPGWSARACNRWDDVLRSEGVPALVVLVDAPAGAVADVSEALDHRYAPVPLLSARNPVGSAVAVRDLVDGAAGVVDLAVSPRRFAVAAGVVAAGGLTVPVTVRWAVLAGLQAAAQDQRVARDRLARMTPRQREVLTLMAVGHGPRGVADRLGVSVATARTHADRVRAALAARSQMQAGIQARWTLGVGTARRRAVETLWEAAAVEPGPPARGTGPSGRGRGGPGGPASA